MASKLYSAAAIAATNKDMVREISQQLGLAIPEDELQQYVDNANEVFELAKIINQFPQIKPEVAYPRTPGYRPEAKDNPYNAWYVKTDIKGAESGILAGKTVAIKDNISVAGVPMMNGSWLLEGHVPDYDASVITRILKQGGRVVGKAVCENLCFSGNSFTSATGPVLNPKDPTRSAGGSSSGCGVLVATGDVDMAIGGDQGGSIRIPASWCGIVGLKPTHGLVPYTGAIGLYSPVDHLGPMTRTVQDCALLLQAIAGPDDLDARQIPNYSVPNYLEKLDDGVKGMRIAMLKEGFDFCKEEQIKTIVRQAAEKLQQQGCILENVSVPLHKLGSPLLAHVLGVGYYEQSQRGGITPGTGSWHDVAMATRLQLAFKSKAKELPSHIKSIYINAELLKRQDNFATFAKAENLVPSVRRAYDNVLKDFDVIILPTVTYVAPKIPGNDRSLSLQEINKAALGMPDNTLVFNLTGHPALSINAGNSAENLPVGMMIVGKHYDEATVLRIARAYEKISTGI